MSFLRRGHADLLCIVPVLSDDPRRETLPGFRVYGCALFCSSSLFGLGSRVSLFCELLAGFWALGFSFVWGGPFFELLHRNHSLVAQMSQIKSDKASILATFKAPGNPKPP